jgi:hypothetical protein
MTEAIFRVAHLQQLGLRAAVSTSLNLTRPRANSFYWNSNYRVESDKGKVEWVYHPVSGLSIEFRMKTKLINCHFDDQII